MFASPAAQPASGYVERLWPPVGWWIGVAAFCLAVWWAVFVATTAAIAAVAGALTAALVFGWLWSYGGIRIAVDQTGLRAAGASLPWRYVGEAAACDAQQTKQLLGVSADARAFLVVRPYVTTAVRVEVDDERDPAPYWLLSTRRPDEVAARLNAGVVPD